MQEIRSSHAESPQLVTARRQITARSDADQRGNAALDALRIGAAGMVFVSHLAFYHVVSDTRLASLRVGVVLFFGLSGYLLYRPFVVGRPRLKRYFLHRAARIFPAYLLALVGVSVLSGDKSFFEQPITYLLFLQNFDERHWQGFLGVSWTLVVEVWFYLLLPFIAWLVRGRLSILVAVTLPSLIAAHLVMGSGPIVETFQAGSLPPLLLWAFAPGMAVALLEGHISRPAAWAMLPLGVALLMVAIIVARWPSDDAFTAGAAFCWLVWAVTIRPRARFAGRLLAAGAAVSYSFYLWHADVIVSTASPVLGLLATLAIASACYVLVERPIIRLARFGLRRRPPILASPLGLPPAAS